MLNTHAFQLPTGDSASVYFDRKPDCCPICHHAVDPRDCRTANIKDGGFTSSWLEVVFQCTRHDCARFFIARYIKMERGFCLQSVVPKVFLEPSIPQEVAELSPSYKEIYSQAAAAESHGLDEIAGVGYRKALEFLIKDYCTQENQNDAGAIKAEFLGTTIANRVSDSNIQDCAKRAAWLGNDETHYVRRWEGKDIRDLKILIQLTMGWIRSSILTKRYVEDMESSSS